MSVKADSLSLKVPEVRMRCRNATSDEDAVSLFAEVAVSYVESSVAWRDAPRVWSVLRV